MSKSNYIPLKDLTTWTPNWTICGRVTEKSPINTFRKQDGGSGKIGRDAIRGKFWGEVCDKWMDHIELGKIYKFSKGRIQVANKRYSNLEHGYEITFDLNSVIELVNDSENESETSKIPLNRKFNFTKLSEIRNSSRTPPYLVDLLGIIKWASPNLESFINRTNHDAGVRRVCIIADDSGYEITLTLFGELTKLDVHSKVVALQNVQIRQYRGLTASSLRNTHIEIESDIPAIKAFREWFDSKGHEMTFEPLSESVNTENTNRNTLGSYDDIKTLAEINEIIPTIPVSSSASIQPNSDAQNVYTIVAQPSRILYANRTNNVNLMYPGCKVCNRKLIESFGKFHCETCKTEVDEPNYRYVFSVQLTDETATQFTARVFHDAGKEILKRDANELAKVINSNMLVTELPEDVKHLLEYEALWEYYRMRIRIRREYFADTARSTVTIIHAEPLNFELHAKKLKGDLEKMLSDIDSKKRIGETGDSEEICFNESELKKSRLSYDPSSSF